MTQEEKQLLLADLCARLPYGVIYHCNYGARIRLKEIDINRGYFNYTDNIEERECKPYLRPMSSMTEDEIQEYAIVWSSRQPYLPTEAMDWLNKKMFDYRGLIKKGLALEAPKDMYKEK